MPDRGHGRQGGLLSVLVSYARAYLRANGGIGSRVAH